MEPARIRIDVDTLLAEAAWVRKLAHKLVRDRAQGEDVVQETWLAALRAPSLEEGRLRPWLARVVLNFARQARRAQKRRVLREERAARPERLPPASEAVERIEAQRLIADAIEALAEPYRMTVIMRYFDGLSAEAIAKRQGVPSSTVRWRLKKSLDDLRVRLDGRFDGDRKCWALTLLPLVQRPSLSKLAVANGSAALQGMLVMSTGTKLCVAAAIVLTASVGVWLAREKSDASLDALSPSSASVRLADDLPAPVEGTANELDSTSAGSERASADRDADVRTRTHAAAAPIETRIEARFIDRLNRPIQGVKLVLASFKHLVPAESGQDGRAAVAFDATTQKLSTELEAVCPRFATWFGSATIEPGRTVQLGDIALEPGGSVSGWIIGPKGGPARDTEVIVTSPEVGENLEEARTRGPSDQRRIPHARSAENGTFRIDGVRAGLVRVWAADKDSRWAFSDPIDVPEASVRAGVELRLTALEKGDTIEGIALSPDGEPVPRCDIRYTGRGANGTWNGNFMAGDDGRFRHRLPVQGPHDLVARDRDERWPDASVLGVLPGTHDVVLRFPVARWTELSVRSSAGTKVEEFAASVLSADRTRMLHVGKVEVHAGGIHRMLVPGESFVIDVRARGHGNATFGPYVPETTPASLVCTLDRRPGVRGRVTAAGEPISGARLALYELTAQDTRIESNGFETRLHPTPEDSTTSDEDGYFELDPSRPGSAEGQRFFQRDPGAIGNFAILCDAGGWARAEVSPLEIDPRIGLDGVRVDLVTGGAIEGRVRTAPGRDPAGIIVAVDRCDGKARTQRVDHDGFFRFEHLTPGRFNVTRVEKEAGDSLSTSWSKGGRSRASYASNCNVTDGATTRFDLDLLDDRPCVLSAHVSVNGLAASGWTAVLSPREGSTGKTHPGGAVNAGGALRLEVSEPGQWELELSPPSENEARTRYTMLVEMRRGENVLPIEFQTGRIRGRLLEPSSNVQIYFNASVVGATSMSCDARVRPDADGKFELTSVPAGRGRLLRMKTSADGGTEGPSTDKVIDVVAGGIAEVEIH